MRMWMAMLVATGLFGALALATAWGDPGWELPLPEVGSVAAEWLPDGTPVFVTRPSGDEIFVLDARRPQFLTEGLEVYTAFCANTLVAWDPFYGATFDTAGYWLGGPAPQGLAAYEATHEDGVVRVGPRRAAPERHDESPLRFRPTSPGACAWTLGDPQTIAHYRPGNEATTPEALAAGSHRRPVLTLAAVERVGPQAARACSWQPAAEIQGPLCPAGAPEVGLIPFGWLRPDLDPDLDWEGRVFGSYGLYEMSSDGGRLRVHAVMPEQIEYAELRRAVTVPGR